MPDTHYDTFADGIGVTTLESDRGPVEDIQENSPIAISGVAIPENTILQGGRGEEHFYAPQMAERAAEVLQQQIDDEETTVHIVKNFHELEGQAPADDIVGEVTAARYADGIGVTFTGEITDESLAQKIEMGYLDVSPAVARSLGDFDDTMQARGVEDVGGFRDIAVVGQGQPGAEVQVGSNPAIEALSRSATEMDNLEDEPDDGDDESNDTMSLDDATETIAEEFDVDAETVADHLETLGEDDEEVDENTILLIEE